MSITWTPIMAFAMLALAFTIGDFVSSKTKGIIASILTVDILFLIFGGMINENAKTLKTAPATAVLEEVERIDQFFMAFHSAFLPLGILSSMRS